jgi:hypothetical protein
MLRAVDEALVWYLAAADPGRRLVPLSELAKGGPYSQEYLSLRARQGALEAVKVGRAWHSSRAALEQYVRDTEAGGAQDRRRKKDRPGSNRFPGRPG